MPVWLDIKIKKVKLKGNGIIVCFVKHTINPKEIGLAKPVAQA
jgi:hypothetical protein